MSTSTAIRNIRSGLMFKEIEELVQEYENKKVKDRLLMFHYHGKGLTIITEIKNINQVHKDTLTLYFENGDINIRQYFQYRYVESPPQLHYPCNYCIEISTQPEGVIGYLFEIEKGRNS